MTEPNHHLVLNSILFFITEADRSELQSGRNLKASKIVQFVQLDRYPKGTTYSCPKAIQQVHSAKLHAWFRLEYYPITFPCHLKKKKIPGKNTQAEIKGILDYDKGSNTTNYVATHR